MTKDQVVAHFGNVTLVAKALGVSQPSVTNWGDRPPELRQLQIEAVTGGKLKAGPECDKFRVAAA